MDVSATPQPSASTGSVSGSVITAASAAAVGGGGNVGGNVGMVDAHRRARWVQFNDTVTEWSDFAQFSSITKR